MTSNFTITTDIIIIVIIIVIVVFAADNTQSAPFHFQYHPLCYFIFQIYLLYRCHPCTQLLY